MPRNHLADYLDHDPFLEEATKPKPKRSEQTEQDKQESGGFLRWPMTLHYKICLVSTGRVTWEEVFSSKSALLINGRASEATEPIGTSRIPSQLIPLTVCPSIQ